MMQVTKEDDISWSNLVKDFVGQTEGRNETVQDPRAQVESIKLKLRNTWKQKLANSNRTLRARVTNKIWGMKENSQTMMKWKVLET